MSKGKRVLKNRKRRGWLTGLLVAAAILVTGGLAAWKLMVPEPSVAVPAMGAEDPARSESGLYKRKDRCWTFLLVGIDKVGSNTDSLMIVTYNVGEQTVSVASIPRDTCVNVQRRLKKINAAYANGGMDQLREEVSRTFGIPIDFYIKAGVQGFVSLVDAVGGVDFEVPCNMSYDDPAQGLSIHYQQGMQHLTGQQALEVCRFRHNNDNTGYNDTGRMETQRGVLTAIAKKLLAWNNITKIGSYLQTVTEYVETDLSVTDMMWFAEKALSFDTQNLNTMMMPASWRNPYMYLHPEETLELVNQYLNPYTTDRTADMLDIVP